MIKIGDLVQFYSNIGSPFEGAWGIVYAQEKAQQHRIKVHWFCTGGDWLGVYDSKEWFHPTLMRKL